MDEDMIILDDVQETATPQADEINQQNEVEAEDTTPVETEQEQTETPEVQTESPKIKVKFNHEERELTLEEATQLAQKGMNYDKTIERLKTLESDPRFSQYERLEKLADKYSVTVEQLIEAEYKHYDDQQIQKIAQRENVSYEFAERLYKLEQKDAARDKKEQDSTKEQESQKAMQREWNELVEDYPDIKDAKDIPTEVLEYRNRTGKSLADSMRWHELQQTKNELKVLKQNESNKKKAPVGSVTSHGSSSPDYDAFLDGFDSYK